MAPPGGKITSLSTTVLAQLATSGARRASAAEPNVWFGPGRLMAPVAPPGVGGRQFDYPFGLNLQYVPRSTEPVSFAELRALADTLPLLRAVIETRKDQIAALPWGIRLVPEDHAPSKRRQPLTDAQRAAVRDVKEFLKKPDKVSPFHTWMRSLLEDMLVIDAATIYPRQTLGGGLYSLDVIDGATIKPVVDQDGRRPAPPDPAFQQVLKGVVAADFTQDELFYLPRNVRTNKIYGFSPVEQIVMLVNIALRRDTSTLEYYRSGSVPDSFGTLPKEWTIDQIKAFQSYFDGLMVGNTQARRGIRFMPSDFKYEAAREPPLKDLYDEWLARLICFAFSVSVTPLVSQVNRATSETQRIQASEEGLVPLKLWVKSALDHVVQTSLGQPEFEFAWLDGDTTDPAQEMTTLTGYVQAGVLNRDEVRDRLGEDPIADGTGGDYTVSGSPLNPARLPTPEEKQAEQDRALALIDAKRPPPGGDGDQSGSPDLRGGARENTPEGNQVDKLAKYDENQPRDDRGRFASTGAGGKSDHADNRPRDEHGRFIPSGGSSRSYTAAAKRKRLLEGMKNAAERAVVGGVLIGGAALAATVFAPEAGAAALTIGIARAVGVAAVGEAASAAVLSVLDYLKVPAAMRDSVQTGVHLALGAYGLAEAKTNFETYMRTRDRKTGRFATRASQQKRGAGGRFAAKGLGLAKADDVVSYADVMDAIRVVLYEVAQDVVDGVKVDAATNAPAGSGKTLKILNAGLDKALEDFLDKVDALGTDDRPDGGDRGSATEHPTTDVSDHPVAAQKLAKSGEGGAFAAGVLFMTPDGKALFLRRAGGEDDHGGEWCLPGGKIEPGETDREAAVRESDEEAGVLDAISIGPEDLTAPIGITDVGDGRHFHTFLRRVPETFDVELDTDESSEFAWVDVRDPPQPLHPGVARTLPIVMPSLGKLAKRGGPNWKALEPMWQAPAHEARSVRRYKTTLSAAFSEARKAVAGFVKDELTKVGKAARDPDVEALAQKVASQIPLEALGAAAGPLASAAEQAAREIADGALVRVGLGDDEGMVERVSQRAVSIARERAAELVGMRWDASAEEYVPSRNPDKAITSSTRDMIRTVIADGLEENLSADDIAERIEQSAAFSPERADLVAKTEITNINSGAALETYKAAAEAGVRLKKRWIVAADDVCDDCTKNANQGPIDLDEPFQSGDLSPAAHPHCRCALAPVVQEGESDDDETTED